MNVDKPTLSTLETDCRRYADAREALAQEVLNLTATIESFKRARLPAIKKLVARAADRHGELKGQLEAAPDLFIKRRTHIFHGIKIGYQKGRGGIAFADADQVCDLICKHYDVAEAETLMHITCRPNKEALEALPAADLKKLGCTILDTADQIVIKPTDSAVDKIVNALLADATADENVSE